LTPWWKCDILYRKGIDTVVEMWYADSNMVCFHIIAHIWCMSHDRCSDWMPDLSYDIGWSKKLRVTSVINLTLQKSCGLTYDI
jgi:hypothetical protein